MRYRILPYKQASRSAKALSVGLGGKVLRLSGSHYSPREDDLVINWGSLKVPENAGAYDLVGCQPLNRPDAIAQASNKLTFFKTMSEVCPDVIPKFWTGRNDIPDDAYPVVCRTVLAGHSGEGIVMAATPGDVVEAPLYVQYVKKKDEYRIHCGRRGHDTQAFSIQRKARRLDTPSEQVDWQVRNHSNGFVFVRSGVNPPSAVVDGAKRALEATGLDFGAVDVVWNQHQEKAYVLEINTAPGLEGQTVQDYVEFFKGVVT